MTVRSPTADRRRLLRNRLLAGAAVAVTAAGIVLASLQPAWLTAPLQALVADAGVGAPVVFVLLCIVAAPAHLSGVLVALSVLVWPLPVAAALSYVGTLLGCVVTIAALAAAGAGSAVQVDTWPRSLQRLATRVARHPLLVGLSVRVVLQSGMAVEGFFLVTGYSRRNYLISTVVGQAIWLAQTLVGIAAVGALARVSPWMTLVLIVVPLAVVVGAVLVGRRRRASGTALDAGAPADTDTGGNGVGR